MYTISLYVFLKPLNSKYDFQCAFIDNWIFFLQRQYFNLNGHVLQWGHVSRYHHTCQELEVQQAHVDWNSWISHDCHFLGLDFSYPKEIYHTWGVTMFTLSPTFLCLTQSFKFKIWFCLLFNVHCSPKCKGSPGSEGTLTLKYQVHNGITLCMKKCSFKLSSLKQAKLGLGP